MSYSRDLPTTLHEMPNKQCTRVPTLNQFLDVQYKHYRSKYNVRFVQYSLHS